MVRGPFFSPTHINYAPLISEYYNLFGKDNVLVLPYEMFGEEPIMFIQKLSRFLDAEIVVDGEMFNETPNRTYHQFVTYHLRKLNLFITSSSVNDYSSLKNRYTKTMANVVFNVAGRLLPSRLNVSLQNKLKNQINNYVEDRYAASNKNLGRLIGVDLSPYGYY